MDLAAFELAVHDRVSLWPTSDLRMLHERLTRALPRADATRDDVLRLVVDAVADRERYAQRARESRVASAVAAAVAARWEHAGVRRFLRDGQGRPVPWTPGAQHVVVAGYRCLSPSGKSMVYCLGCDARESPHGPGTDVCMGAPIPYVVQPLAEAILGGVVYAPDESGMPHHEPSDVRMCLRCERFGRWTRVDRLHHQVVCDVCVGKPSPEPMRAERRW